jgi:GrpB-like predicted nucleotidyltransferase (UPF0157 family)
MIGLKRGTVKLTEHNPAWERSFWLEAKRIKRVFGQNALDIQHIGSTSISGISAKPIIDIAIIVPSLEEAKRYILSLKEIGYELKKGDLRTERLFFTKGPEEKRTHYLHVGERGNGYVEDMIMFRDYLCENPDEAKKYDELKRKLAEGNGRNREVYTAKKGKFVQKIVAKAKNSCGQRSKSKKCHGA